MWRGSTDGRKASSRPIHSASIADLRAATGYESVSALKRGLDKQGVPYFLGKDGPWTTMNLLESAKLGAASDDMSLSTL